MSLMTFLQNNSDVPNVLFNRLGIEEIEKKMWKEDVNH